MRHHPAKKATKIAVVALIIAAIAFALALALLFLWNWLMPAVFGLKAITYWQALGLLIMCWILFGGLRHGNGIHHGHWRHRMLQRLAEMTPEDREKLSKELRDHWHHHHSTPLKPEV